MAFMWKVGKFKRCFFFFLSLCLGFLSSCGRIDVHPPSSELRLAIEQSVTSVDPRVAHTLPEFTVMKALYEGLTRSGPSGSAELALAEEVDISKDGLSYTFSLRESKWSDGSPLKAQDFVRSWKSVLNPKFPASYAQFLYPIENAEGINKGNLSLDQLGVEALDDQTLLVKLERPVPYFLELLTLPVYFPVHHEVTQSGEKSLNPLGVATNGPFLLTHLSFNDELILEKNPSYWDASTVKLQRLSLVYIEGNTELMLYEQGSTHWAGSPLGTLPAEALPSLRERSDFVVNPSLGTGMLRFNTRDAILKNSSLRRALALSIDRKDLVEHVLQGGQQSAQGWVPPSLYGRDRGTLISCCSENQKAQELLKKGLRELGKKELPTIVFRYYQDRRYHQLAQALQQQWSQNLGIHVELQSLEGKLFFSEVQAGHYQISLGSWFADYRDPMSFLEIFTEATSPGNRTGWEQKGYQELIRQIDLTADGHQREELIRSAEQLLLEEAPIAPLFHYSFLSLRDPSVKGLVVSDAGHLDFKWVEI